MRKGARIDGWLVLDKPEGLSSGAAVARVKRLSGAAKLGHAGTLDPLATGVLPLAFGEATKTVAYLVESEKSYRFTIRWGEERSTGDREGEVAAVSAVRPTPEQIVAALGGFTGEIAQVPPVYSAVKVEGRRAYALARAGASPTLPARRVRINRLALESVDDGDHATFVVDCGKGTYVRSLAADLAAALGTLGHLSALRRLRVGRFTLDEAWTLQRLEALGAGLRSVLLPVEAALSAVPEMIVSESQCRRLGQGQPLPLDQLAPAELGSYPAEGTVVRACQPPDETGAAPLGARLVALARREGAVLRPLRILHISSQPVG